ncbi:MAG: type VI secretion system tip protein VgrG [Deltaproteobacteria bacterium]|nr:type VI secretion system tip protein VgrG [Deltaproteobacteria bacterium]
MRQDVFTLKCDKLKSASFVGFRGTEQVSRPYEFELFFTVPVGSAVRGVVGERATITGERTDSSEPFVLHGVIASVRLLHQTAERALYQALLVPSVWLLRQFWRSYVFTHKPLKEFLSDTLKAGGVVTNEFRFDIQEGLYPTEEFVAQYRETHLDFLHRWLEREGLYYYFEHKLDVGHEVMIVVDERGRHRDFPGSGRVSYVPIFGDDVTAPEGLHQLEAETRWLPKSVTVADYNYANPSATLRSEGAVTKAGHGAITEYGYRSFDQDNIKRLASVRGQAIGCRETMLRASGDVLGPRAGYRFAVDERPDDVDETWLAIEVSHVGAISGMTPEVARLTKLSTKETYEVRVMAVPATVQYRAPQETVWPRIFGFENGVVCGDATSQYAQLDKDGRYLVRFEFDTSDLPDGKASTRVRMLQPHGGEKEGFHFPLRKGTEVMIGFLGGDPDRPFIAGVVPNAHKPSVVGERNHTQNVIRSGSGNQIVLEDDEGKEFVYISSPNNRTGLYMGHPTASHGAVYTGEDDTITGVFRSPANGNPANPDVVIVRDVEFTGLLVTEGNLGIWNGGDSWENVGADKYSYVHGDAWYGISGTHAFQVACDSTETFYANRSIDITEQLTQVVGNGKEETIKTFFHQEVVGLGHQKVTDSWLHSVKNLNTDDYGEWKTDVKRTWTATIGGNTSITSQKGTIDLVAKGNVNITSQTADVKISSPNSWHKFTKFLLETYVQKTSFGMNKIDNTATSIGLNILKTELNRASFAMTLLKVDLSNSKIDKADVLFKNGQVNIEVVTSKIHLGAIKVMNWAFTKM